MSACIGAGAGSPVRPLMTAVISSDWVSIIEMFAPPLTLKKPIKYSPGQSGWTTRCQASSRRSATGAISLARTGRSMW